MRPTWDSSFDGLRYPLYHCGGGGRLRSRLLSAEDVKNQANGECQDKLEKASLAMRSKASGGTRQHDQRPILVFDVIYRIRANGVVLTLTPTVYNAATLNLVLSTPLSCCKI